MVARRKIYIYQEPNLYIVNISSVDSKVFWKIQETYIGVMKSYFAREFLFLLQIALFTTSLFFNFTTSTQNSCNSLPSFCKAASLVRRYGYYISGKLE